MLFPVSRRIALSPKWTRNLLWRQARAVPSLDLRFAENKSLVDATTGQNLVTFSRASSGTYVDSEGLIKTAVTNLLLRSEEFGTTWTTLAATISADQETSPAGTLTGDKLVENVTTGAHYVTQAVSALTGICTASVYIKAAGVGYAMLLMVGGTTQRAVGFNLSTGATYAEAIGGVSPPDISAAAVDVGNGWWRCRMTWTADGQTTLRIQTDSGTGTGSTTGNGTSGIYLWGAQLEQSSTVGEYIPTTSTINSAPRFDHNPTTRESLGLLVEESRTNLVLRSEEFNDAVWTKSNSSITANASVAPNGTLTSDKIIEAAAVGTKSIRQIANTTVAIIHTASCYLKASERSICAFEIVDNGATGNGFSGYFNLSTGASSNVASFGNGSGATASIAPVGDGWYRCSLTGIANTSGTALRFNVYTAVTAGSVSYTGDGTSGIYIWGAQLEAGSFATSYIPTTTATVTRSADVASVSGSNFSSWYRQDEGTVFGDFTRTASTNTQQGRVFSFSDGTNTNLLEIYQTGASNPAAQITVTTLQAQWTTSNFTVGASTREVLGYQLNNTNTSFNGSSETTDTVCTMPIALTQARIGDRQDGVRTLNGTIRRLTFWPTRLSNTTLQQITQ